MATFQDIIIETYALLWEPSDWTSDYDEATRVKPRINDVLNRICKGNVRNLVNQQRIMAGELPFLKRDAFIQSVQPKAIQTAITISSTQIELDTTDYLTSGSILLWQDIISYTGKTATELTGVSWINISHNWWEKAYQLYPLPNNISLPFTLFVLDRNGEQKEVWYVDYRYPTDAHFFYTILTDNSWANFLHIRDDSDRRYKMVYYVNSVLLVNSWDISPIPDPYSTSVIAPIVAGELLWDTEELEDAQSKLSRWYANLVEMYDYYNSMIKKNRDKVVVVNPWFNWLWHWYGKR